LNRIDNVLYSLPRSQSAFRTLLYRSSNLLNCNIKLIRSFFVVFPNCKSSFIARNKGSGNGSLVNVINVVAFLEEILSSIIFCWILSDEPNRPIFQDTLRCVQLKTEVRIQKKVDALAEKWGLKKPEN
jgi:hypothetical protein